MALEKLSESLTNVIKKITFAGMVDEKLVKEVVKDIQRALLSADVNVKLVMNLSKAIEERALKEKPKAGVSRREHVIKIVYEELVSLLGERRALKAEKNAKIMLVGLQGSGKTTTAVKLAKFYMKRGMKPFIIAGDTFRPAAYEQILQLAEPLGIGVYGDPSSSSISVLKKGMDSSKGSTIVLLDTAGRHKSEKELFDEMRKLSEIFKPDEKILVADSNVGQQAGAQARAFHEAIGITGVILTKVDGSAKGGGALSAVAETSSPILFIGTGEKIDDFELFDPDRFISRLIGMGDLATLLEKAKETVDEDEAKKIMKGDLTFLDLQSQIKALMKMGPLSSVMKMIPGLGMQLPKEVPQMTEEKMKKFLVIMDSMTLAEKKTPKILNSSRTRRIARGSGTNTEDVKELVNYYKTMKRALKGLKKIGLGRGISRGKLAKMMREQKRL